MTRCNNWPWPWYWAWAHWVLLTHWSNALLVLSCPPWLEHSLSSCVRSLLSSFPLQFLSILEDPPKGRRECDLEPESIWTSESANPTLVTPHGRESRPGQGKEPSSLKIHKDSLPLLRRNQVWNKETIFSNCCPADKTATLFQPRDKLCISLTCRVWPKGMVMEWSKREKLAFIPTLFLSIPIQLSVC